MDVKRNEIIRNYFVQVVFKTTPYPEDHVKQVRLRQKFALMLGTTSIPASKYTSFEFPDYIHEMNPKHKVPRRTAVMNDIMCLYDKENVALKASLK